MLRKALPARPQADGCNSASSRQVAGGKEAGWMHGGRCFLKAALGISESPWSFLQALLGWSGVLLPDNANAHRCKATRDQVAKSSFKREREQGLEF